jgi:hypothetical protein
LFMPATASNPHVLARDPDVVAREDLVVFINACTACTGQREFYETAQEQRVSVAFLHEYIAGNYRMLYAQCLALGINDFNKTQIIINLLKTGKKTVPAFRSEENALIWAGLQSLPTQRAWKLLATVRRAGINNRRSRAIAGRFLCERKNLAFEAVKYRRHLCASLIHSHQRLREQPELREFLFGNWKQPFTTPLFEQMRQARYSEQAIYNLPYSIAEGMAAKHGIERQKFLHHIAPRLTERERLRVQGQTTVEIHPQKLSLTVLSLSLEQRRERQAELSEWLFQAALAVIQRSGAPLVSGKVATVLDNSYSSSGSREKMRRPLAVAVAVDAVLQAFHQHTGRSEHYRGFWTQHRGPAVLAVPFGQSNVAERMLDAAEWGADTILIVSDGAENDPHGGVDGVLWPLLRLRPVTVLHLNPVFAAERLDLRGFSVLLPPLGLRNGEDLAMVLGFGQLVMGKLSFAAFEAYLQQRVAAFLGHER